MPPIWRAGPNTQAPFFSRVEPAYSERWVFSSFLGSLDDEADNTPRGRGRGFDAPLIGASDSEDSDAGRRGNEREAEDSDEVSIQNRLREKGPLYHIFSRYFWNVYAYS